MDSTNKSAKNKTSKPVIKRRNFFLLFGAAAIGAIAMVKSPVKLLTSKITESAEAKAGGIAASSKTGKNAITVKENPHAVKRGMRGGTNG